MTELPSLEDNRPAEMIRQYEQLWHAGAPMHSRPAAQLLPIVDGRRANIPLFILTHVVHRRFIPAEQGSSVSTVVMIQAFEPQVVKGNLQAHHKQRPTPVPQNGKAAPRLIPNNGLGHSQAKANFHVVHGNRNFAAETGIAAQKTGISPKKREWSRACRAPGSSMLHGRVRSGMAQNSRVLAQNACFHCVHPRISFAWAVSTIGVRSTTESFKPLPRGTYVHADTGWSLLPNLRAHQWRPEPRAHTGLRQSKAH
jgi:hypothetical protein